MGLSMKNKFLALSALALLAACSSDQESALESTMSPATPGSPEDFKQNHRDRVFFKYNHAGLSANAKKVLADQATWLKTYGSTKATVEGKCDIRGTAEYNRALGAKRAESARSELVAHGVSSDRLKTVSYGKDKPEVPGNTPAAHAQNRVAITVVE